MKSLSDNRQGIYNSFKSAAYAKPALVPAMAWRDTLPPLPPTGLAAKNRQLTWKVADNQDIRSWTLYKQSGGSWTLERILPGATRATTVALGTYALCAVDRMANESAGVVIAVS